MYVSYLGVSINDSVLKDNRIRKIQEVILKAVSDCVFNV